jgi:UDPglucose 6-dehydrogenase
MLGWLSKELCKEVDMRLSIIGTGHVGLVTGACFAEKGHEVMCVDNDAKKIETLKELGMPFHEPGLSELLHKHFRRRLFFSTEIRDAVAFGKALFICVGTPPTESGAADMTYIEAVSREITKYLTDYRLIIEKSTVPVRTGERLKETILKYAKSPPDFDVASNPEFLREGSAVFDSLHPERIVIGVENKRAEQILREIYAGFDTPVIVTDIITAELIKHACNSFLALKISYINAIAEICEKVNANVEMVAHAMGLDSRIGPQFLKAGIGYGGACFPKDVEAFYSISRELGYNFKLLEVVQQINQHARQRFVKKLKEELWVIKNKRIGALGLSFKPNTDDVRDSPALDILRMLFKEGAVIKAFDPMANRTASEVLPEITYCKDPYKVAEDADCLLILTDWDEFRKLDFERIKGLMATPTIIDGRNLLDFERLRAMGFTYKGVGRP